MRTEDNRNEIRAQDIPERTNGSESYEDPLVSRWLKLAKRMLDGDDDPTPSPA